MPTICRHCKQKNGNRPRGLCWTCYHTPDVLARYPSTSKFAKRGVSNSAGLTPQPTAALPGTEEKIAVLTARALAGESLWHPDDARGPCPWQNGLKFARHYGPRLPRTRHCHLTRDAKPVAWEGDERGE